ncbi:hypothetical protein JAAARDRAFT_657959 [Jaapia argillacea MUCL 33604]|uniref:NACHT-NTPase and P-loop NTPases N-terminal domain-containing protein n=1 Tax=Jaapia argillacea MUCL 33604 TaxID=933084 RepID=A0A067PZF8_9AGAM|nr:hypothetical protein JAAARDRAFT_657959 [Jaapia argillacea MUCL 33604]
MDSLKGTRKSGEEKRSRGKVTVKLVQTSLDVLGSVADAVNVPGLKPGLSALSLVVNKLQKTSQNVDDLRTLSEYLPRLTTMIQNNQALHGGSVSDAMKSRIESLLRAWSLAAEESQKLKSHSRLMRFISSDDDAGAITGIVQSITWAIHSFLVEGSLAIEFALDVGS